jgi:hypothetical protein
MPTPPSFRFRIVFGEEWTDLIQPFSQYELSRHRPLGAQDRKGVRIRKHFAEPLSVSLACEITKTSVRLLTAVSLLVSE